MTPDRPLERPAVRPRDLLDLADGLRHSASVSAPPAAVGAGGDRRAAWQRSRSSSRAPSLAASGNTTMDVTPNTRKHEARETERALADAETIALFFFDVLGFFERVEELGLPRILEQYESLLDMIQARASGQAVRIAVPVDDSGNLAYAGFYLDLATAYFGDTVLIWTRYDPHGVSASVDIVLDFFCDCLRNGLPLRGGRAFGDAVMDESRGIFLGQPIIEAARAEAAQRWCGCTFGPSLDAFAVLGPLDRIIPYRNHVKPGRENMLSDIALDWPRRWEKLFPTEDLDAVLDGYRRPGFESYWDVTQAFADHSRTNRDWWKSLPAGR
jgi:class 3 adenylate cyclase